MRAVFPLDMICSTIVLPRRLTLPASVRGASFSAMVSMPPMPVPMMAPVSQSATYRAASGLTKPASRYASMAAMAA